MKVSYSLELSINKIRLNDFFDMEEWILIIFGTKAQSIFLNYSPNEWYRKLNQLDLSRSKLISGFQNTLSYKHELERKSFVFFPINLHFFVVLCERGLIRNIHISSRQAFNEYILNLSNSSNNWSNRYVLKTAKYLQKESRFHLFNRLFYYFSKG